MSRELFIVLFLILSSIVSIASVAPVAVADDATIDAESEEVIIGDTDEDGDMPESDEVDEEPVE